MFLLFSGDVKVTVAHFSISIYSIKNAFRFFLVLLCLKVWIETKQSDRRVIEKIEAFLTNRYGMFTLICLAFFISIWIKYTQHYTFHTGAFDLSMYDHALSNTLKGKFMYTPWLGRNFFSEHFSPVLLLLLPFYCIYDCPIVLVIAQAVITVLSAFPLYFLAKEKFSRPIVPFCIIIAYLNYRYLLKGFYFDFHMEIFEPLFIFSAFLFLRRNKPVLYFLFVILALACKEDMPIYMCAFGGYVCLVEKKWKLGTSTIVLSILWAFVAWKIVIPMSYPDGQKISHFLERWKHYGQTYTEIAWGLFTHPTEIFGKLFFKSFKKLLSPLGFIPLASPTNILLSLPPVLLNITSEFDLQKKLYIHYALPIVPFLFISLLAGMENICKKFPQKRQVILTVFCVYLLMMNVHDLKSYPITRHDILGHELIASLPQQATIAAQTSIIPHLQRSHQASLLPYNLDADYIIFDQERFTWPMSDDEFQTILQSFMDNPNYDLLSDNEGFFLFRKKDISESVGLKKP